MTFNCANEEMRMTATAPLVDPEPHVDLSWAEVQQAGLAGMQRNMFNVKRDAKRSWGADIDGWTENIRGAIAEMAVARHFDVFWTGTPGGEYDYGGDVGTYQVRSVHRPTDRLAIKAKDNAGSTFILVWVAYTIAGARCTLRGWITAREARSPEWWETKITSPAHMVPVSALHPMAALPPIMRIL